MRLFTKLFASTLVLIFAALSTTAFAEDGERIQLASLNDVGTCVPADENGERPLFDSTVHQKHWMVMPDEPYDPFIAHMANRSDMDVKTFYRLNPAWAKCEGKKSPPNEYIKLGVVTP